MSGRRKIPSLNVSKHRLDVQFDNVEEAIAMSAMYAANHLKGITAIITMTESGRTALMTSRISSGLPIFALSRHERTLNLTALYRGVTPVFFDSQNDGVAAAHDAVNLLRDKGYLVSGDLVVVTQGDVMSTIRQHQHHPYPHRRVSLQCQPASDAAGRFFCPLSGRLHHPAQQQRRGDHRRRPADPRRNLGKRHQPHSV
ncbi:hypothetical protein LNO36_18895 [Klebsiella variicola subsp. variicola]|nr:hypothetical protein [Klebsiella variicola subsp. variicola]